MPERRQLNCERTRALASLALDSDLSEVERLHVVAHVEKCGECSRIIGTMERLTGELRAAATLTPPRMPRIMVAPRRRSLPVARLAAFAGAVLVAGLAGALLSISVRSGPTTPPAKPVIRIAQLRLDQLHSGDLLFKRLAPDLRPSRAEQLREHLEMV